MKVELEKLRLGVTAIGQRVVINVPNKDGMTVKFQSDNCVIYRKRIDDFIKDEIINQFKFNLNETFAICSYVPTDTKLIRETFKNLFIYYPHGGYEPFKFKSNKK